MTQKKAVKKNLNDEVLKKFQNYYTIPNWNKEPLQMSMKELKSKCDWLDMLITAVFITHSKVLVSVKIPGRRYNDIQLDVPSGVTLYKCYIEGARKIWQHPYLFYDEDISNYDYQRNIRDIEK